MISLEAGDKFAEFPPNPMQFRAICLGFYSSMDLPTSGKAFDEFQRLHYQSSHQIHPVVRYMAKKLPESFYKIETVAEAWKEFSQVYDKVCNLLYQGHALPELPEPKTIKKAPSKAVSRRHLDQMKAYLSGKK